MNYHYSVKVLASGRLDLFVAARISILVCLVNRNFIIMSGHKNGKSWQITFYCKKETAFFRKWVIKAIKERYRSLFLIIFCCRTSWSSTQKQLRLQVLIVVFSVLKLQAFICSSNSFNNLFSLGNKFCFIWALYPYLQHESFLYFAGVSLKLISPRVL